MQPGLYGFPQGGQATAAAPTSSTGRWLRTTVFTSNGTWTKIGDASYIVVHLLGAGGGGGAAQSDSNYGAGGASGAGGGGCIKYILATALGATEAVSIGAGGSAGTSALTDGSTGGTSSFGAFCSASGGEGGRYAIHGDASVIGPAALGGIGTGGDVNFRGGAGSAISGTSSSHAQGNPGGSGAHPIGSSGAPGILQKASPVSTNGVAANANSGGGGSGGVSAFNSGTKQAGGNGGSGLCVVYEFA